MKKIIKELNKLFSYRTKTEYSYYTEHKGKIVRVWYQNGIEDRRVVKV